MDGPTLVRAAVKGLRRLDVAPEETLAAVSADHIAGHVRAAEIFATAVEVDEVDRPLWLEAVFHAAVWCVGMQRFKHTVEIRDGTLRKALTRSGGSKVRIMR